MPARATSLIELKKRQWDRERDDMRNYGGIWRHFSDAEEPKYRPCIRGQFKSNLELKTYADSPGFRKRTPSLPPINTVNYDNLQTLRCSPPDEGDTSGYASDSANEYNLGETWTKSPIWPPPYPRKTPESTGERAKWGDRGVGIGRLWTPSPHLPNAPLPLVDRSTPSWLNRGLREPAQVLVIAHEDYDISDMSKSYETLPSEDTKSYLRGQTTPSDPQVIADRERRRQKALEQHNAIKKQVEEKEKKKREEQERLEREEKVEEERLKKYQEIERLRIEEELKKQKEKAEKEERIAKAMKEALEIAERTAKEEKARLRRKHLKRESPVPKVVYDDVDVVVHEVKEVEVHEIEDVKKLDEVHEVEEVKEIQEIREIQVRETQEVREIQEVKPIQEEVQEVKHEKIDEKTDSGIDSSAADDEESHEDLPKVEIIDTNEKEEKPEFLPMPEYREITLAVSELRIETEEIDAARIMAVPSPGRLLTPSIFRNNFKIEKSTQTDSKTRAGRSKSIRIEDRPKWGVNKPSVRYIKASDRDPYRKRFNSRSPSPLNQSKSYNFGPLSDSSGSFSSQKTQKTSKSVGTPRFVQVLPNTGIIRKTSAGRKYLSIKNGGKTVNRPSGSVLSKRHDISDILTVKEVLAQLTALKKGLNMKQKEWAVTRSPTPFSEVSSVS